MLVRAPRPRLCATRPLAYHVGFPEGQQLRYCGVGAGFDDVIIDGNLDELKFVAYYVKQDKVIAVAR